MEKETNINITNIMTLHTREEQVDALYSLLHTSPSFESVMTEAYEAYILYKAVKKVYDET